MNANTKRLPFTRQPMLMARQPIFNASEKLFGYELLYRQVLDEDRAADEADSARVLSDAIAGWSLEQIVGSAYMFVRFDQCLLESELPMVLPAGQGVAEVMGTVKLTRQVLDMLLRLRTGGICISLDCSVLESQPLSLLRHVDFVKVDVENAERDLQAIAARFRPYKVALIAEKVGTRVKLAECRELGFKYFQGAFFAKPELMQSGRVDSSKIGVVSLIAELQNPHAEASVLAKRVGADIVLSHQILKLANSAAFRRQRSVSSILDAVVLLGRDLIRQWASIFLMSRLGPEKPQELVSMALVRGCMCETLGGQYPGLNASEFFTVGLLSMLDALLDRCMSEVVAELPLSTQLRDALCGNDVSPMGITLRRVISYETGNWTVLESLSESERSGMALAYNNAVRIARKTLESA